MVVITKKRAEYIKKLIQFLEEDKNNEPTDYNEPVLKSDFQNKFSKYDPKKTRRIFKLCGILETRSDLKEDQYRLTDNIYNQYLRYEEKQRMKQHDKRMQDIAESNKKTSKKMESISNKIFWLTVVMTACSLLTLVVSVLNWRIK